MVEEKLVEEANTFLSLSDAHTWILFSAIIFAYFLWSKGRGKLIAMMDGRSARIKKELEEAEFLKQEAAKLLAEYRDKHAIASKEAEDIIKNAKEYAETLRQKAHEEMDHQAQLIDKILHERIKKAEHEAIQEINSQAINFASTAVQNLLQDKMQGAKVANLDAIVDKIPKKQ